MAIEPSSSGPVVQRCVNRVLQNGPNDGVRRVQLADAVDVRHAPPSGRGND